MGRYVVNGWYGHKPANYQLVPLNVVCQTRNLQLREIQYCQDFGTLRLVTNGALHRVGWSEPRRKQRTAASLCFLQFFSVLDGVLVKGLEGGPTIPEDTTRTRRLRINDFCIADLRPDRSRQLAQFRFWRPHFLWIGFCLLASGIIRILDCNSLILRAAQFNYITCCLTVWSLIPESHYIPAYMAGIEFLFRGQKYLVIFGACYLLLVLLLAIPYVQRQ